MDMKTAVPEANNNQQKQKPAILLVGKHKAFKHELEQQTQQQETVEKPKQVIIKTARQRTFMSNADILNNKARTLFGRDDLDEVKKSFEFDAQVMERIKNSIYVEKTEPKVVMKILMMHNQIQYIPHLAKLPLAETELLQISYALERKASHICTFTKEYGTHTKMLLRQITKCLDMVLSLNYKRLRKSNAVPFIELLEYKIKMYSHNRDAKGLKKFFENQLKPLSQQFLTNPTSLCSCYNALTGSLIALDELNFLYEEVFASNMKLHYEIVKRVPSGILGTPLFVTVQQLLKNDSGKFAHKILASKMALLGVEFLEYVKRDDTKVDFISQLSGCISRNYADLFEYNSKPLLTTDMYFGMYLDFVSYYWNMYRDILESTLLKYVSVRYLCLQAKLAQHSAYDVSSSREAEFVMSLFLENQIPFSVDVGQSLLIVFSHIQREDKCIEVYDLVKKNQLKLFEHIFINQSMTNAYAAMANFEKAFYYATLETGSTSVESMNALLKAVSTMLLPNLTANFETEYVEECLQKTLQLFSENNVEYDGITLNTLINIYGLMGKLPLMIKHFQMLVDAVNERRCVNYLNAITYTTVIKHLCANNQFETALDMFHKMREGNIKPTHVTYKVLIEGMVFTKNDCLPAIMKYIKEDRVPMDDHLIGSIVLVYASRSNSEPQMLEVLNIVDKYRTEYTPKVYEHLVFFYCKQGDFVKARGIVFELLEKGIIPSIRTILHFASHLKTAMDAFDLLNFFGRNEEDILDYIKEREEGTLDSLISTIYEGYDHGVGLSILKKVMAKIDFNQLSTKIDFASRAYNSNKLIGFVLIGLLSKKDNVGIEQFVDMLNLFMKDNNLPVYDTTNALMLLVYKKQLHSSQMKDLYRQMIDQRVSVDIRCFNIYLECVLESEGVDAVWREVQENSYFQLDVTTLGILVKIARHYLDIDFIYSKHKSMIESTKKLPIDYLGGLSKLQAKGIWEDIKAKTVEAISEKEKSIVLPEFSIEKLKVMQQRVKNAVF